MKYSKGALGEHTGRVDGQQGRFRQSIKFLGMFPDRCGLNIEVVDPDTGFERQLLILAVILIFRVIAGIMEGQEIEQGKRRVLVPVLPEMFHEIGKAE